MVLQAYRRPLIDSLITVCLANSAGTGAHQRLGRTDRAESERLSQSHQRRAVAAGTHDQDAAVELVQLSTDRRVWARLLGTPKELEGESLAHGVAPALTARQFLNLKNCSLTDEAVKKLCAFNQLERLQLWGNQAITDQGIVSFASSLTRLTSLDLCTCIK